MCLLYVKFPYKKIPWASSVMLCIKWAFVTADKLQAREFWIFYKWFKEDIFFIILDSKQIWPVLQRETLSQSSKAVCYMNIVENIDKILDATRHKVYNKSTKNKLTELKHESE